MAGPLVLGIESSCDDTAAALVDSRGGVLASVVSSQLEAHRPYGGVVPEIASREHLRNWPAVCSEALARAGRRLDQVEVVAATRGPGLVGALLVGLSLGRAIAWARGLEFHAVHHLEGHLYSPFLRGEGQPAEEPPPEFVGLVVSGGHTSLYAVTAGGAEVLAETRDDAFGEAFDKFGKRLGLAYPQGPRVDELAERGTAERAPLPVAAGGAELFFSYSGLKTQALLELEKLARRGVSTGSRDDDFAPEVRDLVAGFRAAAVDQVLDRIERLRRRRRFDLLAVSGGAAANRLLRRRLTEWAARRGVALRLVPLEFSGDNAAMIAHCALLRHRRAICDDPRFVEARSRLAI